MTGHDKETVGTVNREALAASLRDTLEQYGVDTLLLAANAVVCALLDTWDREAAESDRLAGALLDLCHEAPPALAQKMLALALEHQQHLRAPTPLDEMSL